MVVLSDKILMPSSILLFYGASPVWDIFLIPKFPYSLRLSKG